MPQIRPTLAAVVPATNRPPTLERCLAAIRSAHDPPDEVIVVEDPPGAGPAEARNVGAHRASSDVVVFVDADVEVHEDAFRRIRGQFERDPALAGVFGSYDDRPADRSSISRFRNLLHHHVHHESPGPASTFWAGLGALRRDVFLAVGGFDADRYSRPSVEDIELGMRLAGRGELVVLDPSIQGTHLKRWTFLDMIRTDLARRGIPWATLLLDGRGSRSALNLGPRHRASAVTAVALAAALVSGRRGAAVAAAGAFVGLNRRFHLLLARRLGPARALLGVGLHVLHHLVGVTAGVVALARHLARATRRTDRGSR